jgi:16S rRNA (uracil1498-N3)-methyltransferase
LTIARFYVSSEELSGGRVVLAGQDHHHLSRVLRMRRGQEVTVMDGCGLVGRASIHEITPMQSIIVVEELVKMDEEQPRLHLYQAIPGAKKMDTVVRGAVESGICFIIPFSCHRSGSTRELSSGKMERWRKIALETSRLAGRSYLPEVSEPLDWDGALQSLCCLDRILYADERGGERPALTLGDEIPEELGLMVGPEGGFTDVEREDLAARGARAVTLGKNIMRTDTAGLVLTAAVRCHYGLL